MKGERVTADSTRTGSIEGLSIEDALDEIDPPADERTAVREALTHVAQDGTVCEDGAQAGLSEASLVVSTVENRTEVASDRLSAVRETAARAPDSDLIGRRLSRFERRLRGIRDDGDAVAEDLEALVDQFDETTPLEELGERLRSLTDSARSLQQRADECYVDLDDFEAWLEDPSKRRDALHADLDAIEETLSVLEAEADRLERGDPTGRQRDSTGSVDPGLTWVDATIRLRVAGLLLADVREEHAALQAWGTDPPDEAATDTVSDSSIADRLESLQADLAALDDRLSAVANPHWRDRFGAELADLDAALDGMAPPVEWGEVQATLEAHRERIASGK